MPAEPLARRRARLVVVLSTVAVLLAGAVSAPVATAAAADSIVLSGLLRPEGTGGVVPPPTGEVYRVQAVNDDGVVVKQVVTDETYSMALPAGASYAVRAELIDDDSWYPTWAAGNPLGSLYGSPLESDAFHYSEDHDAIDILLSAAATVSGTVTAASAPGVSTTDFVVQAWYSSDSQGLVKFSSERTTGRPGVADAYSFSGENRLPVGTYVFRLAEEGYPAYDDEYFDEIPTLDKYVYQSLGDEGLTGIDFTPTPYESSIARLAGVDRYETAVLASRAGHVPDGRPLYVASGATWPDALSAGPAASVQGGSLLLTDPAVLPDDTAERIELLRPDRIVVVGSSLSVSDAVLRGLDALTDAPVVRIGGRDRYETSRRIVADAFPRADHETVFLATGTDFPDALSAAPIAGRRQEPVLLVDGARGALDAATRSAIDRLSPATGELLGGTPSISSGIETSLRDSGLVATVHRVGGLDRHDTSRLLNDLYPPTVLADEVFLASATSFADALAAGPVAAERGAPLYLSEQSCVPEATRTAMQGRSLDRVTLLGGTPTLAASVETLTAC